MYNQRFVHCTQKSDFSILSKNLSMLIFHCILNKINLKYYYLELEFHELNSIKYFQEISEQFDRCSWNIIPLIVSNYMIRGILQKNSLLYPWLFKFIPALVAMRRLALFFTKWIKSQFSKAINILMINFRNTLSL